MPEEALPRVLWITAHADPSLRSGGALRTARLIRELTSEFAVDVVVVGSAPIDARLLAEVSGAASARWLPGTRGVAARWLALRKGWPFAVARMHDPLAGELLREDPARVVVAEHPQAALYHPGRQYVLHLQNAEGQRIRELPVAGGPVERAHRLWERRALPRWEHRAVHDPLATVVVVSPEDAEALGVAASVVPNGTDLRPARELPDQGTSLFVGALDYAPNRAGLEWWAREVWPHLPAGWPPLTVVGRGGRAALGELADHPSLEVIGEVDDLDPYYRAARVVVVPLLHGGGTRLKILEAMAWSIPVVSTSKGAEGLVMSPGRDLVIADSPRRLAEEVVDLHSHDRARQIGTAGRAAVTRYSWASLGDDLRAVVRSTLERNQVP